MLTKKKISACVHCHRRKIKCDLGSLEEPIPPCTQCRRQGRECLFSQPSDEAQRSRSGASPAGKRKRVSGFEENTVITKLSNGSNHSVVSIGVTEGHQYTGHLQNPGMSPHISSIQKSQRWTKASSGLFTRAHSSSDALDMLAIYATEHSTARSSESSPLNEGNSTSQTPMKSEKRNPIPHKTPQWHDFKLIKNGTLLKSEVQEYCSFFFSHLTPLIQSQLIPKFYYIPSNYVYLVSDPILLGAIIAVSSRYYALEKPNGRERSDQVHTASWRWTRSKLQGAVWGQTITRTFGTIAAYFLIIEWNPHSDDFVDDASDEDDDLTTNNLTHSSSSMKRENGTDSMANLTLSERKHLLYPKTRSDRMSWMMLANAISIAQELKCFTNLEEIIKTARDPDELEAVWKQNIWLSSYLLDCTIQVRLGRSSLLPVHIQFSSARLVNEGLLDPMTQAMVEIVQFQSGSKEILYDSVSSTTKLIREGRYIPILHHYMSLLSQWWKSKRQLLEYVNQHGKLSLVLSYEHLRLFIFSLGLEAACDEAKRSGFASAARIMPFVMSEPNYTFIRAAADASAAILKEMVNVMSPLGLITIAPVRIYLGILCAAVFLVKVNILILILIFIFIFIFILIIILNIIIILVCTRADTMNRRYAVE